MSGPIDNRFPRIYSLDSPRVPKPVAEFAEQVCLRCWCHAGYDIKLEQLHFYYDDVSAGFLQLEGVRPDGSIGIYAHNVQDVVEWIQRGKIEKREKQLIDARNEAAEEYAQQARVDASMAERRPDAEHYAAFLMRQRRGLGQRIFVP